jgi:hypothetical protein
MRLMNRKQSLEIQITPTEQVISTGFDVQVVQG